MGLSSIDKRLEKYQERLAKGKVEKIKPRHIHKVIAKLTTMEAQLTTDLAEMTKPDKRKRFEQKMSTIREQINKAKWLETKI
ncbi:MAG: hypothetical protein Pars93KO_27070 [Parasphingorhabdus sp.]